VIFKELSTASFSADNMFPVPPIPPQIGESPGITLTKTFRKRKWRKFMTQRSTMSPLSKCYRNEKITKN